MPRKSTKLAEHKRGVSNWPSVVNFPELGLCQLQFLLCSVVFFLP